MAHKGRLSFKPPKPLQRRILAKFPGRCSACGENIPAGSPVLWTSGKGIEHAEQCPSDHDFDTQDREWQPGEVHISNGYWDRDHSHLPF